MSAAPLPSMLLLFDIGPMEFMVVIGAAIMLFGGDLPDVARKAGRGVRKLRTMAGDLTRNLDLPQEITKLPGAAEFRQGLDLKEDLDMEADLGLKQDVDLDWREISALPAEAPKGIAAGPAAPAKAAVPAPTAAPPAAPAAPAPRRDEPEPA